MEKDINECIEILNERKEKYPNISFLWLNIMKYRIKMLNHSLKQIKELGNNVELLEKDMDMETILLLYNIQKNIYNVT